MSGEAEIKAPYKGLIPYSEEDAEFFFGRESERNFITSNLLGERLTLLYGASGVGKSSVLRAGVEHHLKLLAKENMKRLGKPKYLVVVFNDWRDTDPVKGLLGKVQEAVKRVLDPETVEPVGSSLRLTDALFEWSKRVRGQLLIILDQFEEYFLYHSNEDGKGTFAEEFPQAINTVGLPTNFLVSFREDAFAKLAFFKVRMPDVFGNYLPLQHLDHEAGRDAIVKPIEQFNRIYANGKPPLSIEPDLVEEVLKQVETGQVVVGEAGRGSVKKETIGAQIETPFLQMVMMRLWEEETRAGSSVLRLETLNRLADKKTNETGAERIVRTHLDEKMNALPPEKQDIAAEAFHYLVTPSGTKIAHTVPDLAEYAKLPSAQLGPLLESLAAGDMRILRGVSRLTETRYEIFHDVLAAPVLDWRARHMKAKEQAEAARKAQLQAREQEKAHTAMLRRAATAVLAIMLVIAVALLFWALNQRSAARAAAQTAAEAQKQAEKERKEADKKSTLLQAQTQELEKARKTADDEKQSAITQSNLATANAIKARQEKSRAVKNLDTAINFLQVDIQAADDNYRGIFRELGDACDQSFALKFSKEEYQALLQRYQTLGAKKQISFVAGRIREIDSKQTELERKCSTSTPKP